MSRKYIKQIDSQNFVYPNYELAEYDIELVQNINNNRVDGTLSNLTGTSISYSAITFSFDYTWDLDGAEPYINQSGNISTLSVHLMTPDLKFYKPFRMVHYLEEPTGTTSVSGSTSFTVYPADFEIPYFDNGDYVFEFRFIGHKIVLPAGQSYNISTIVPPVTPTPTPTPTPTATPTPTPTPTVLYQSGATINVTDTGWIRYQTTGGTQYEFVSVLGSKVINPCVICSSIGPGFPYADLAVFTLVDCGSACSYVPPPPTPTPTPSGFYYIVEVFGCFPCQDLNTTLLAYSANALNIGEYVSIRDGNVYLPISVASVGIPDINLTGGYQDPSCGQACVF